MFSRRLILPVLGATAALALAGCSSAPSSSPSAGGDRIAVVASTNVWGDIASTVGGDHVSVTSIIDSPDKDPHEYEADAQTQLKLSKAQVVIENGGGYDDFVDTMLKTAGSTSVVKLDAVDISGKSASGGDELNEHVWYDFPTVEKVIDKIEAEFSTIDGAHSVDFARNADAVKKKIDGLASKEADVKSAHSGAGVAITEPVPLYMLDAMGLVNKTPEEFSEAVEEDRDVPVDVLNETLKLFSGHEVELLAYNEQTTGPQTEQVLTAAKTAGVSVVPVTETLPEGKDYVSWMSSNIDAITNALD